MHLFHVSSEGKNVGGRVNKKRVQVTKIRVLREQTWALWKINCYEKTRSAQLCHKFER